MVEENRNTSDDQRAGRPGEPLHPSVQFEHSDVRFDWILGVVVAAVILGAIILTGVFRFFVDYSGRQSAIKSSGFPLAERAESAPLPAQPRLEQINRLADSESSNVYQREKAKESVLESYGKMPEEGYIHIPIGRAMELLEKKLPARTEPRTEEQEKRENGLVNGGAANSGRMLRGKTDEKK
jgi:hypothetical protein